MALVDVASASDFKSAVGGEGGRPAVVHFWASWCEPCKHMDLVLRQLAAENTHATFLRVEAEEQADISEEFNVSTVPLFLFFKGGKAVDRLEGANAPELAHKVAVHISKPGASPCSSSGVGATASSAQVINSLQQSLGHGPTAPTSTYPVTNGTPGPSKDLSPALRQRLQALVVSQPVLLFMKGSPEEPRCGFSSKVVAALNDLGFPYSHFDILGDEEVRQGLKVFSDWPTFPQLYAGGELVGGCDIILEMKRSGELRKTLEKASAAAPASAGAAGAGAGAGPGEGKGREAAGGVEGQGGESGSGSGSLEDRLKTLIASSPTMLFMKGSPEAPQCGFSRRVVEALQETGIQFGSFDILSDEAVRQGLKVYSAWPTFPQLYHRGEFVGGCDIVMELKKNGELKGTLTA